MFPSGEVSHWQMPAAQIVDPAWNDTVVRSLRKTGATALPVGFLWSATVSALQLMGMLHPKLRTAFLLQEFLQKEGKTVEVRIGTGIPADTVEAICDDREATEYLRWRIYLLARRSKPEVMWHTALRSRLALRIPEPVAAPVPADLLAEEVERLPIDRCLAEKWRSRRRALERRVRFLNSCSEVGRLVVEMTFRCAGEVNGQEPRSRFLSTNIIRTSYCGINRKHEVVQARTELAAQRRFSPSAGSTASTPVLFFRYDERIFQQTRPSAGTGTIPSVCGFGIPAAIRAPSSFVWKGIARMVARAAGDPGAVRRSQHQQRLQCPRHAN